MANTNLFPRLRRLFSTDVIIRNVGGKQVKVMDSSQIQANGGIQTNSLVDRFNRIYSTSPTSLYGAQFKFNYQYLRPQLYSEYDVMDSDAIIASALDIIADESTLKNDMGEVLSIRSSNEDIQKILYNLFYDVLNIEFNAWSWVRQMCKYGDFFLKMEIAEEYGVYNIIPYTAYHIERQEGYNAENPAETRFRYAPDGFHNGTSGLYNVPNQNTLDNQHNIYFDNYEMAHFRLISDVNYLPYGRSYIEPARKLYKQYTLMEEAMLIHRITRAAEKRVFYMNVGSIPPNEIDAFMQKTINTMKASPLIDEKTGEYDMKYNIQNMMEDFYIPVRGNDTTTKIDTTPGLTYDGITDIEYLREKLFAALKVPKAFLGYEKDLEGKATLAAQDIRFARTIERLQRILCSEFNKIALVHLYSQGYRDEALTNYEISMQTPSIIFEQEKVELLKSKTELATALMDSKILPTEWIYDNIFNLSEDQYEEYRDLMRQDAKRKFRIDQIENEGNDPVETGKSFGTPHDLAYLYGKGRTASDPANLPDGYNDEEDLGRPEERITNRGKQENNFGKDALGVKGMKDISSSKKPLQLETTYREYLKNKALLEKIPQKETVFSKSKDDSQLLNENQLRE
jgi:hypothetical protein